MDNKVTLIDIIILTRDRLHILIYILQSALEDKYKSIISHLNMCIASILAIELKSQKSINKIYNTIKSIPQIFPVLQKMISNNVG